MYTSSIATSATRDMDNTFDAKFPPALLATVLGATLIFLSGFAQTAGFTESNLLHNAAHDARHSAGFPCH
uniref:Cobalt transporter subunit CbtB n=1 Tax=Candidatus Kentrum sp. LFY TaxID=2126342 RepID=A0A450UXP1_9GAMM|nr:MAG: cobalt transporter subunit CbtB [Candidatus Kentron sp. LFY]VFK00128.1 MAG: cobalt transporter subunit CbtB [Candidatus Kentron sp. LFY]VFK21801.1 MAG: cobalt transporter subunit CbtB [Candidatus Kentron sp. LFY]